jgi:putative transposase
MATKRVTFRIYPSKSQEAKMHYWRKLHKDLYNACLAHRKSEYRHFGRNVTYFEQQNCLPAFKEQWYEYKELGSHALQATAKRVDFAFKRFFRLKSSYPKFKSSRYYKGWTYPCKSGWKTLSNGKNGKLKITNIGEMQMRGQARDWGIPKTCTIMYKQGKWYASITVECVPTRHQTGKNAIGLDFGTQKAISDDKGNFVENPRFLKYSQTKINKIAKKSRGKRNPKKGIKASRRWKKASKAIGKIQSKVARQRHDWHHKVAVEIVSDNSFIATEKLNLKGMTATAKKGKRKRQKSGLNRSILDVGIGDLKSMIKYKVSEAGGIYIEIPTKKVKPSQTCPKCGYQKKKDLSQRVHSCSNCGFTVDRDTAAAMVILNYARGKELASLDAEPLSSIDCGSMRQLGAKKRQKRTAQRSGCA